MNKTININLGGFFFHIDETAYIVLKKYLEAITKSLSDDPQGKDEILTDIEARISELLSEKITDNRQVINEQDIQDIITIMGQPEDYADVDDNYNKDYLNENTTTKNKKLFRDSEDKFLGGVASGIGHYFNIDPIWIRLALIILLLVGGFGVYTYIILWILIPTAKTTAEKLQMHGEPVNINNIEKKIRTEFDNVSNKIKNADYGDIKTGLQQVLETLGKIAIRLFNIVSKLIGIVLILLSVILLCTFVIGIFSFNSLEIIGINNDLTSNLPFFYQSSLPNWLLSICIFFTIGIPLIMLFYLGVRILSNSVKQMNKILFLSLLGLWIVSFLTVGFTGVEFHTQNAYKNFKVSSKNLAITENDSIYLKVINDDNLFINNHLGRSSNQTIVFDKDIEKLYTNNLYVNIRRSENKNAFIKIKRKSEGKNRKAAYNNADNIEYNYEIKNQQLILNSYFLSPLQNRFKNETVIVDIYIPTGSTIFFNESSKNFIHHFHTTRRMKFWKLINHHFKMTTQGLDCTDCNI